jgi:aldehyde:ferredoxin oxidoreductase
MSIKYGRPITCLAAMHVKGLELPAHDTRTEEGGKAWALQYGTGNRGMCHVHPHEPVIVESCHDELTQKLKDLKLEEIVVKKF